jgi:hypothetical protein
MDVCGQSQQPHKEISIGPRLSRIPALESHHISDSSHCIQATIDLTIELKEREGVSSGRLDYASCTGISETYLPDARFAAKGPGRFFAPVQRRMVDSFPGCVCRMGVVGKSRTETRLELRLKTFDFVFGCHHAHLSRVFQTGRQIYRVCCDCGTRFDYSLATVWPAHLSAGDSYEKRNLVRPSIRNGAVGTG